jgi:hypothetical protein
MELAEYTNAVVGVVSMQAMFGSMPNISPATGEPETTGETKAMLDMLRSRAKIRSFDQATASCSRGKTGVKVLVANNPKDNSVIWVSTEKANEMFWMPKAHLDLRK